MIKEFNYTPSKDEENFLQYMQSPDLAWYYQQTVTKNFMNFGHCLLKRHEKNEPKEGEVFSPNYEYAKNLFLNVCKQNNVIVDVILRAAVNNCFHYPEPYGDIHQDHPFPHYNFIYYVNETDAPTYLFDEHDNVICKSSPSKNKVAIFDGVRHANGNPKIKENRIVLVFTFLGTVH